MWSEGVIGVPASVCGEPTAVHYWVKHYQNPSLSMTEGGILNDNTL